MGIVLAPIAAALAAAGAGLATAGITPAFMSVVTGGLAAGVVAGGIVGGYCGTHQKKCPSGKRDLVNMVQPAIFHFNTTNLRGRDVAMLRGLQMARNESQGEAMFSGKKFRVEGTVTDAEPIHGLKHGQVSFTIPGLDEHVEGIWVMVNTNATCNVTKPAFESIYSALLESYERPDTSFAAAVQSMVKGLETQKAASDGQA